MGRAERACTCARSNGGESGQAWRSPGGTWGRRQTHADGGESQKLTHHRSAFEIFSITRSHSAHSEAREPRVERAEYPDGFVPAGIRRQRELSIHLNENTVYRFTSDDMVRRSKPWRVSRGGLGTGGARAAPAGEAGLGCRESRVARGTRGRESGAACPVTRSGCESASNPFPTGVRLEAADSHRHTECTKLAEPQVAAVSADHLAALSPLVLLSSRRSSSEDSLWAIRDDAHRRPLLLVGYLHGLGALRGTFYIPRHLAREPEFQGLLESSRQLRGTRRLE